MLFLPYPNLSNKNLNFDKNRRKNFLFIDFVKLYLENFLLLFLQFVDNYRQNEASPKVKIKARKKQIAELVKSNPKSLKHFYVDAVLKSDK